MVVLDKNMWGRKKQAKGRKTGPFFDHVKMRMVEVTANRRARGTVSSREAKRAAKGRGRTKGFS